MKPRMAADNAKRTIRVVGLVAGLQAMILLFVCALAPGALAAPIGHRMEGGVVRIDGVGADNPILYDNDWWTDVPDAAYLWTKASFGEANLVGNVVTRCTFGWETKYAHTLEQQLAESKRLFELATASGLRNCTGSAEMSLWRPGAKWLSGLSEFGFIALGSNPQVGMPGW